jgi:signal transduction histidine kinase
MAERVEAAGGELELVTAPGSGAKVHLRLPVPAWSA